MHPTGTNASPRREYTNRPSGLTLNLTAAISDNCPPILAPSNIATPTGRYVTPIIDGVSEYGGRASWVGKVVSEVNILHNVNMNMNKGNTKQIIVIVRILMENKKVLLLEAELY